MNLSATTLSSAAFSLFVLVMFLGGAHAQFDGTCFSTACNFTETLTGFDNIIYNNSDVQCNDLTPRSYPPERTIVDMFTTSGSFFVEFTGTSSCDNLTITLQTSFVQEDIFIPEAYLFLKTENPEECCAVDFPLQNFPSESLSVDVSSYWKNHNLTTMSLYAAIVDFTGQEQTKTPFINLQLNVHALRNPMTKKTKKSASVNSFDSEVADAEFL